MLLPNCYSRKSRRRADFIATILYASLLIGAAFYNLKDVVVGLYFDIEGLVLVLYYTIYYTTLGLVWVIQCTLGVSQLVKVG